MEFLINSKLFTTESYTPNSAIDIKSYRGKYTLNIIESNTWSSFLRKKFKGNDCLIIDQNVYSLHAKKFHTINTEHMFILPAAEETKTMDSVMQILDVFNENSIAKTDTVFVIGGGIIQDIASLACNIYKRGVAWTFFPTTLLAMSDSCIGSKSSINFNNKKNQLGFFFPPSSIIIDTGFLNTLSHEAILSGNGEILKLSIIGGPESLNTYSSIINKGEIIDFDRYSELIRNSLLIKKAVIEVDEFDTSYRLALNYGHTLGHIIESLSAFTIPHGQSISYGMLLVNTLNNVKNEQVELLTHELIEKFAVHKINYTSSELASMLHADKKVKNGNIQFVFINKPGETIFSSKTLHGGLVAEIGQQLKELGIIT
ncbi:MAG: 3-dehydroquinate synthase [Bacteroidetes bacterium]|nr:3-dehydroquinate synthase [Bacteroidota bacterium]